MSHALRVQPGTEMIAANWYIGDGGPLSIHLVELLAYVSAVLAVLGHLMSGT